MDQSVAGRGTNGQKRLDQPPFTCDTIKFSVFAALKGRGSTNMTLQFSVIFTIVMRVFSVNVTASTPTRANPVLVLSEGSRVVRWPSILLLQRDSPNLMHDVKFKSTRVFENASSSTCRRSKVHAHSSQSLVGIDASLQAMYV